MRVLLKYLLQKLLGYKIYLYTFAVFKIKTLRIDAKETDFFFFLELIRERKGVVLDIGANVGVMSYHLAKQLPHATILAYEPTPDNNFILQKVIFRFNLSNVKVNDILPKNSKGKTRMLFPQKDRIQAIKIDVDNFEYFVFKETKEILKRNKPIIYAELWDSKNRTKCFDLLKSLNYTTFVVINNKLHPYNQAVHNKQNFIFVAA